MKRHILAALLGLLIGAEASWAVNTFNTLDAPTLTLSGPILVPDGSASAPSYSFSSGNNLGIYKSGVSTLAFTVSGLNVGFFDQGGGSGQRFNIGTGGTGSLTLNNDVYLERDAADTFAQRRSTNPQTFRLYNTFTDANNHERLTAVWSGNVAFLQTENAGTGTQRDLHVGGLNTYFRSAGVDRVEFSSLGNMLWSTDNLLDIGAFGAYRPRNVYIGSALFLTSPTAQGAGTYTVAATDTTIINSVAATLTLPAVASSTGRRIRVVTTGANAIISNASNVVPITGGAAGTAILAATAGKWADLECNGSNWIITASN